MKKILMILTIVVASASMTACGWSNCGYSTCSACCNDTSTCCGSTNWY